VFFSRSLAHQAFTDSLLDADCLIDVLDNHRTEAKDNHTALLLKVSAVFALLWTLLQRCLVCPAGCATVDAAAAEPAGTAHSSRYAPCPPAHLSWR
jgi:hypothetical protein